MILAGRRWLSPLFLRRSRLKLTPLTPEEKLLTDALARVYSGPAPDGSPCPPPAVLRDLASGNFKRYPGCDAMLQHIGKCGLCDKELRRWTELSRRSGIGYYLGRMGRWFMSAIRFLFQGTSAGKKRAPEICKEKVPPS